jgi:hypothetical protein
MAFLLVVLITIILILSSFYLIKHMNHDCTGENCPVCAQIRVCFYALHLFSEAVGVGAAVIVAYLFITKMNLTYLAGRFLLPVSLVRLKIRLDN